MAIQYFVNLLNIKRLIEPNRTVLYRKEISLLRRFCVFKTLHAKEKFTLQLLPEIEKHLESGEIKHRKHPGIQVKNPYVLPEALKNAVNKILSYERENILLEEAKELCKFLASRRLPAEPEEISERIGGMSPFLGDYNDLYQKLSKEELRVLKRRINSEIERWKPIEYNKRECLAYLVGRLAPNYASTSYVFEKLQERVPSFKPSNYFDFGSGVGSSLWAAHSKWSDTIKEYFCVDASSEMNDLCNQILTDEVTEEKLIEHVFFRQFLPASEKIKYDLVVSSFSLMDLPTAGDRLRVIDTLWRKTKNFLIFIERGTVAGFRSILDARDFILQVENDTRPEYDYYSSGAYVVNPCPHDSACPKFKEQRDRSCAFTVPYQVTFPKSLSHVMAKDWISYVILSKGPRPNDDLVYPRIIKPVIRKPKRVFCRMCCPDGKMHEVIVTKVRHGRHAYRCARESDQGDTLPVTIMPREDEQKKEN